MASLPLLLAGPIVRKVTDDEFWFWVATSQEVRAVEPLLTVFKSTKDHGAQNYEIDKKRVDSNGRVPLDEPPPLFWEPEPFRCVSLGQNLFVTLIGMWPKARRFPTDVILGYNLKLTLSDAKGAETTRWITDLADKDELLYPGYTLPTFFIPNGAGILAHASCRRPGADGPDAFSDLDDHFAIKAADVRSRPAALFLTGDQIYADDVAFWLFPTVRRLSIDLMGYDEYLPSTYGKGGKYAFEVIAGDIEYTTPQAKQAAAKRPRFRWEDEGPLGTRRGNILKHGFTTDDGEAHLLTFGEFAAMYLLVWSPKLADIHELEKDLKSVSSGKSVLEETYSRLRATQNLKNFTIGTRAARRVLANVPTYMIFDDHEITDDWNISKSWVQQTDNLFARRVIANGLGAYWAFQAWGTNPSGHGGVSKTTLVDLVEQHLEKQLKSSGKLYRFNDRDFSKPMIAWEYWSYVAPTNPKVIVADMRTHRRYKYRDEAHMDGEVAKDFERFLDKYVDHRAPLFLVLASPLLGWAPMLKARGIGLKIEGGYLQKELGDLFDDVPEGLFDLIRVVKQLADPTMCVVFSGDVHFSHVEVGRADAQYKGRVIWELPIVQITSSPLKNENSSLNKRHAGKSTADLLEESMPTSSSRSNFGLFPNMNLTWASKKLSGKLGHETVIPQNACCLVSLLGPKHLSIEYLGRKSRAYCDVRV